MYLSQNLVLFIIKGFDKVDVFYEGPMCTLEAKLGCLSWHIHKLNFT